MKQSFVSWLGRPSLAAVVVVGICGLATKQSCLAQPVPVQVEIDRRARPPAPPVETRQLTDDCELHGNGGTLWSIGQPTDEEQLYLEFINRSRANPPAE